MKLLVDTVSQPNGLGFVFSDGEVIQKSFDRRTESRFVLTSISEVLELKKLRTSDINQLLVNVGPGSFTGIKVGLSIVQTFSIVHSTECRAYTSFDVISHLAKMSDLPSDRILIYAYQGEYFCGEWVNEDWQFSVRSKQDICSGSWLFQGPEKFAQSEWLRLKPDSSIDWSVFLKECDFNSNISAFYGKQSTAEMNLR